MLQRIQTIWLFLASTALFSLLLFPTMHWMDATGKSEMAKINGVYESINGQLVQTQPFTLLSIFCVLLALIPFIIIFFYQDRKLQIKLAYLSIVAVLAFSFWLAQSIKQITNIQSFNANNYGIGALLPSLAILFIILAIRAIRKDENLIRSADRLR